MTKKTAYRSAIGVVVLLVALMGCSSHSDLPTEQSFTPAPTPTNVQITSAGGSLYDMSWSIANAIGVDRYRVYSLSEFAPPELLGETTEMMFGIDTVIPVSGLPFGVSAVTDQNVEGAMAVAVTP